MENVKNHRDIKLVTINERKNKLVSELSYNKTLFRKFISNRNKKDRSNNE